MSHAGDGEGLGQDTGNDPIGVHRRKKSCFGDGSGLRFRPKLHERQAQRILGQLGVTGQIRQPCRGHSKLRRVAPATLARLQQRTRTKMQTRSHRRQPLLQRRFPELRGKRAAEPRAGLNEQRRAFRMQRPPHGDGEIRHAFIDADARLVLQFVEHIARHEQIRRAQLAE